MSVKRWSKLVDLLMDRTTSGKQNWDLAHASVPCTMVDRYQIQLHVEDSPSGELEETYILKILNEDFDVVDEFSDEDLQDAFSSENYFIKMKELYKASSRNARGSDHILDEIIGVLDDSIPF